MEGLATSVYKGLRGIWRRRGYQKLNGSGRKRPNMAKRVWRVKVAPKPKLSRVMSAPKRFLVRLRKAYVNLMLRIAHSRGFTVGYGGACGDAWGGDGFGGGPRKEYDEKVTVEIYRFLVAAHGLLPRGAGRIGSHRL